VISRRTFLTGTGAVLLAAPLGASEPPESFQIPLRPLVGMRLYYRNSVVNTGSAPSRQIVDKQTITSVSDVVALDVAGFVLTVTLDGTLLPVIARLSHSGELRELVFEAGVPQNRREYLAGLLIFRLTRFCVVNAHSWARGESRPAVLSVPLAWETLAPAIRANFGGNVTFRRTVTISGRPGAEFDVKWVVSPPISGLAENLELTGQYWVDLATGFQLRLFLRGVVNSSVGGTTARFEQTQEDILVLENSKGL
jgi:hypothetical protein